MADKENVERTEMLISKNAEVSPGWRVSQPFLVYLEFDGSGQYVISDDLFDEYGVGETPEQALVDYGKNLIAYYGLMAEVAHKHPKNQAAFDRVKIFIQPTSD